MKQPIIQSKLRIPVVKDEFIRRAKLTRKLKTIPEYPLTIIHSGAGFGKSTALALFLRDEKLPGCWYSISSLDDDILTFLSHLVHTIQQVVPSFGTELSAVLDNMNRYIRNAELNILCSLFINEILTCKTEITMILDDFHQIEHSYTINTWMERLLAHIPANLHIVISSRSRPGWSHLMKMKVCGQLLEITREDLVLTMDEMELLLTDLYGLEMDQKDLQSIYNITEGWIIALCMIAAQIPLQTDMTEILQHSSQSLQDFFQYLVMEILSKQPPMIQQFLEQTSIFEEIDEQICDEVIGFNGASSILEQLKDRNLFIQKVGKKQYRYHALFKEFLEDTFQKNNQASYTALHERSARYYEKKQQWEKALHHYKKINHLKAISSILQDNGLRMLENGKLESLYDQLRLLSETEMEIYYQLWYLKAEVLRYRSNYQEAEECYEKAFTGAKRNSDHLRMSMALEGKAKIFLDTIQPHKAEELLYEAIYLREKCMGAETEKGQLYHLLSENLLNSGKAHEAEKWIQKSKGVNQFQPDANLEARLYLRTGRFTAAKTVLLLKKEELKDSTIHSLPQSHRETDLILSLIEAFTGEGVKAKELAQAGIQQGISNKAPFVEACGWIRMGHGVQILNKYYDLSLAESCYQTALDIMEQLRVDRGKAEPLMGLSILYGTRGELERALETGRKALQETDKVRDVWLSAFITLCMGITCVYNEQHPKTLSLLTKAEGLFVQCEDCYGLTLSQFWLAYHYYLENQADLFKGTISHFLKLVQMYDYEFLFHKRSVFGPRDLQIYVPLLIECMKKDIQPSFVRKILQDMGITAYESHPGYSLRVQTLGHFKLWLGEKEVVDREWQREKAKELFQLLITVNELMAKDEIISILWPSQDKKSADRDFKVALNCLHHVLEPHRKARAAPFFIIREGMFYGLNPNAVIEMDTTPFKELIEAGLNENDPDKVISFLERGLAFYHGDYLPDRRYDDWCISKRESMAVYFLRGAEKMAQGMVRKEKYDAAINWCEKILGRDRTWEEAYRLLMYCYYRKNNRPQAMRWYKKCTEVLEEELGVTPLEPTRHMYQMIIESARINHST